MISNILIAAEQVAILYIIVAVGAVSDKIGVFPEKVGKSCTDLLFYVVTPAKIIESFFTLEYSRETALGLFQALGCGALLHFVSISLGMLFFMRTPKDKAAIFKFAAAFGNCGYMGLPLANAVLGAEGVFYCSAVIITFQVFNFTYGVYVMTADRGGFRFDAKKLILNPGVISVIIGMPIFMLSLKLPEIVSTPVSQIANLNTPLAMLVFGTFIANTNFKTMFREKGIYMTALVKLILVPVLVISILHFAGIRGTLLTALAIAASAPPANNTVVFSAKYDRDTGLASQTVASVSLISVFTMPVLIALSQFVG